MSEGGAGGPPAVVLVVDDERGMRETISDILQPEGLDVRTASSGADALRVRREAEPALAVVDYRLPDVTGMELAVQLKGEDPDLVVIALTGHASLESAIAAVGLVDVYLTKPLPPEQLLAAVRSGVERRRLVDQNRSLLAQLQEANALLAARVDERTRQLSESERRLRAFIDFAPDAVVVLDDTGRVVVANPSAEHLFGVTLVGGALDVHVEPEQPGTAVTARLWAADPDVLSSVAAVGRRPDGTTFPLNIVARRLPGTEPVLLAAALRDETERRETERALRRAYEREREAARRLREADAVKDEFLGTVSHELRTPLTAVSGFAELLRGQPDLDEATKVHLVDRIAGNAEEMRSMVERLLDYARLTAGRVHCEPRPVALAVEVQASIDAHAHELTGHAVEAQVPEDLKVLADPDALAHVLGNLLSNAAKFSPEGSAIRVEAATDGDAALVRVADQGPGIPPEQAEALFARFVQGAAESPPSRRGAGLGLAIAKRYVELQGGRIWFEQPAQGTTVVFTIPTAAPS